jgi:hypothetical protein
MPTNQELRTEVSKPFGVTRGVKAHTALANPCAIVRSKRMPVISITRLRVRSWLYVPAFFVQTLRIARQAASADGNLSVKLLRDRRNTFWTATSWSAEGSMKAFMHAKPHGPTMRKLLHWCDEAALVHWTQVAADVPSWEEAHRRIQADGRPSKVNYPSAAHTAHPIPAPTTTGQTRELRLK